jgi:hypothetical protein
VRLGSGWRTVLRTGSRSGSLVGRRPAQQAGSWPGCRRPRSRATRRRSRSWLAPRGLARTSHSATTGAFRHSSPYCEGPTRPSRHIRRRPRRRAGPWVRARCRAHSTKRAPIRSNSGRGRERAARPGGVAPVRRAPTLRSDPRAACRARGLRPGSARAPDSPGNSGRSAPPAPAPWRSTAMSARLARC